MSIYRGLIAHSAIIGSAIIGGSANFGVAMIGDTTAMFAGKRGWIGWASLQENVAGLVGQEGKMMAFETTRIEKGRKWNDNLGEAAH